MCVYMESDDKQKMKNYVINKLKIKLNLDKQKAVKMVENSVFNDLLEDDEEFLYHYSVDYWVEDVISEYSKIEDKILL